MTSGCVIFCEKHQWYGSLRLGFVGELNRSFA